MPRYCRHVLVSILASTDLSDVPSAGAHVGNCHARIGKLDGRMEKIAHALLPDVMLHVQAHAGLHVSGEVVRVCHCLGFDLLVLDR